MFIDSKSLETKVIGQKAHKSVESYVHNLIQHT